MKKDWYSPGSIVPGDKEPNIKPDQLDWIIEYYEVLRDGRWPTKQSGYIDNPFAPPSGGVRASAYFETSMAILAEFHTRINQCGRDGEAFLCCRCLDYERVRVCRLRGIHDGQLDRILSDVFRYIVGRRKDRSYVEFIRH